MQKEFRTGIFMEYSQFENTLEIKQKKKKDKVD